ncbi:MAG TPA: NAD(+) synthase [Feifaniaceae bacterium]|nr:NAD(+) synthase [Feifaniaceae bacterium]
MRHGFVKVAAGTPNIRVGDCAYNSARIRELMDRAAKRGVCVLLLPELCLTGYTCSDLFLHDALLDAAEQALLSLKDHSGGKETLTAVGVPLRHEGKLYNCAALLYNGRILGVVPKTHLPNYGEFYELRQFTPAPRRQSELVLGGERVPFGTRQLFRCSSLRELCVGVEICEDLWVPSPPSNALADEGATVILNLSASDETIGKDAYRRLLLQSQSARLCCAYLYADAGHGESTTDMVFAGHNLIAENGAILKETEPFAQETAYIETEIDCKRLMHERRRMTTFSPEPPEGHVPYLVTEFSLPVVETPLTREISPTPFIPQDLKDRNERCEDILRIQAHGLKKRIEHTSCKTVVIGISGGLDSTLALLVAVRAMELIKRPVSDILAVTMPCFGTTGRTRTNAERLCDCLGIPCRTVDITAAVRQHFKDIGHPEDVFDVTFENGQARERTQVLMDIANQSGGIVVGTGDLSELALGWATYNGDHMSMYAVNASVPKSLIRHIVRYLADTAKTPALREVLTDILDTPVSPELLPSDGGEITQQTEELVGPYALHDFFLYHMVRWGAQPQKVLRMAVYAFDGEYDEAAIRHWLTVFCKRFFSQQFKRSCLPDGPKVGSVTLSPRGDWRMPSDAMNSVWLNELL